MVRRQRGKLRFHPSEEKAHANERRQNRSSLRLMPRKLRRYETWQDENGDQCEGVRPRPDDDPLFPFKFGAAILAVAVVVVGTVEVLRFL